ncbi:hypothetical protein [Streptomyces sp. JV190]|uniref:hypothetical protein n=1 Tax=Streptomyces sp. JV190 TaxID=3002533 RepID=UPI002E771336|nr:hypothetical protein [Streptomyces sp. JV190]MEE1839394.1 hypothetical protein [Streptomyces sp. JV190]
MLDGIAWIGEFSNENAARRGPGMRGAISLTAARGVEPEEFLVRLGADSEQLRCHDTYQERDALALGPDAQHARVAMYGTCGEWLYVLEDWGMATWYAGHRTVAAMEPLMGEEVVCLTMNSWDPPKLILHAPGDGRVWQAEFAEGAGRSSALRAAGAVFPSVREAPEEEVALYFEEHREELPTAVFTAVGHYCGLSIDRAVVEAGELPLVILPSVR